MVILQSVVWFWNIIGSLNIAGFLQFPQLVVGEVWKKKKKKKIWQEIMFLLKISIYNTLFSHLLTWKTVLPPFM